MKKTLIHYLPYLLVAAGFFLVFSSTLRNNSATVRNRELGLQNNTFLRIMTCLASVTPTQRTPDYVKFCYDDAERINGTQVTRYGDGKRN